MPITSSNPFKWRHFPGEVILLCVRWYLRYPLACEHVSELLAELGVEVDASCIWRWVQAYAPELNKRCRPHLKPTNRSYRTDETYTPLPDVFRGPFDQRWSWQGDWCLPIWIGETAEQCFASGIPFRFL